MKKVLNCFPGRGASGQAIVEVVLIMALLMATAYGAKEIFDEKKTVAKFISEPWETISGMMESGVWMKKNVARKEHPNHFKRMSAEEGETL